MRTRDFTSASLLLFVVVRLVSRHGTKQLHNAESIATVLITTFNGGQGERGMLREGR